MDDRKKEIERKERRGKRRMYRRKREKRTKRIPYTVICSLSVPPSVLHFDSSLFPRLTLYFINARHTVKKPKQCIR